MKAIKQITLATCIAALGFGSLPATASDLDALQSLGQTQFKLLSEDLSAALSYKSLAPAATLGITGFDLSLAVTGTQLENLAAWNTATGDNDTPSTLPLATVRLAKGLPFNIDIGGFYLAIPSTNIKQYGGEVRWAVVEGGAVSPAVSVHATYSKLTGVEQLDLNSKSLDVSISKGFAFLTPYAGVGQVWTAATPLGTAATAGLKKETISQTKYFGGLNFNFGLPNIALEADKTGDATTYGAKFGLRW